MYIALYILVGKKSTYTIETVKDWDGNIMYFNSSDDAMNALAFLQNMENAFSPSVLKIKVKQ